MTQYRIEVREPADTENYDPLLGPWKTGEWHDVGEGPFSAEDAYKFAKAEVGMPWRVVPIDPEAPRIVGDIVTESWRAYLGDDVLALPADSHVGGLCVNYCANADVLIGATNEPQFRDALARVCANQCEIWLTS